MKCAAIVVSAVLLLAACGGGGGSSAEDQIKAAYLGFFSTTGSFPDHEALIEDGTKPTSPIQATHFVGMSPEDVSVSVSKVTLEGADKAKVIFTVTYRVFKSEDRTGYAVLQDGKWKVASATVCELVAIWGSPWPACKS